LSAQTDTATGGAATANRTLLVELDRGLLKTNLTHEALSSLMLSRPRAALRTLARHSRSPAAMAAALAEQVQIDVATLPYDEQTLTHVRAERERGAFILLETGRSEPWAQAVAAHLGCFDATVSREPPSAGARPAQRRRRRVRPTALLRELRPHQWLKNLLVLVALFTAQKLEHPALVAHALEMLVAFCLVSSSVYVLNDLADLPADRAHATKHRRPLAHGDVSPLSAWALWPALAAAGGAVAALTLPLGACLWLLAYYVGTLVYTFGAKRQPILDVIVLAGLYTVRIIAGAAAIGVPVSIWLLTFSMSIFTSLALVKRVSELTPAAETGGPLRGRGYEVRDLATLKSLGVTASYAAVVVLALYVHDPATSRLYDTPSILWAVVPVLLYWSSRLWLLADRGEIDEDPLLFATHDRISYAVVAITVAAFVAAKFVG
jgi:4-hydroxybenzoate polyprenyltransferase